MESLRTKGSDLTGPYRRSSTCVAGFQPQLVATGDCGKGPGPSTADVTGTTAIFGDEGDHARLGEGAREQIGDVLARSPVREFRRPPASVIDFLAAFPCSGLPFRTPAGPVIRGQDRTVNLPSSLCG
mmetsp:Transcript_59787/g.142697  ORF Transcript_59787/g.142697 Transcript_59787/m.142697 type:complete len:127 (+) Transcript_59787:759-1139(+)